MKRCMYCGQENDDANTTCEKCGNPLLEIPPMDEPIEEIEDFDEPLEQNNDISEPVEVADDYELPNEAGSLTESLRFDDLPDPIDDGSYDLYGDEDDYAAVDDMDDLPAYEPEGDGGYEDYEDDGQGEVDAQYGGQAYGYRDAQPRQYGAGPEDDYERGYAQGTLTPLMKASRRRVKSFLFFLSSLLLTVYVAANVVNILLGNALTNLSTVTHTIGLYTGTNTVLRLANTGISMLESVNPWVLKGIGIGLMLPSLLLMFGMWGMFNGTNRRRAAMSTGGYSLARAALIIEFILVCVALLACIVMTVSFVVAAGASGSTMSLIVGIVLLLIVIILAVFTIMYYVQLIFSVKLVRKNVTGEDIGKIPGYAVFVTFLLALCNGLALLPMAPDDYIGLAARGAHCAWLLFITLWAVIYKSRMKKVRK